MADRHTALAALRDMQGMPNFYLGTVTQLIAAGVIEPYCSTGDSTKVAAHRNFSKQGFAMDMESS